jgi:hypothetical protein
VRDVHTAQEVARLVDGKVDYIFVDDEKKIRKIYYGRNDVGNIEKAVRHVVKKSTLLTYKGNDLTVESVDALVCSLVPDVSGIKVAIIGMGNFGSKVAIKLVERGVHVAGYRRDQKKLHIISNGINMIKSEHTISAVTVAKNITEACRDARIVIGVTNEKEVITKDMLRYAKADVILIDAGKGCFTEEVVSDPSYIMYRVDVSIMQKYIFLGLVRAHSHFSKPLGRRYVPEIDATLISIGLLARKGEIIVDDIQHPTAIIGISAGGGVLEKNTPNIQKRLDKIRNSINNKRSTK